MLIEGSVCGDRETLASRRHAGTSDHAARSTPMPLCGWFVYRRYTHCGRGGSGTGHSGHSASTTSIKSSQSAMGAALGGKVCGRLPSATRITGASLSILNTLSMRVACFGVAEIARGP